MEELTEGRHYTVAVRTHFTARFSHYEEKPDGKYAVFVNTGVTDKGNVPYRRVRIDNLVQVQSMS